MDIYYTRDHITQQPVIRLIQACCHSGGYRFNSSLHLCHDEHGNIWLAPRARHAGKKGKKEPGFDRGCSCCMEEHHIYNCSDAEDPTDIDSLWEARQEITQCNPEWTDYGQVTDDDFD